MESADVFRVDRVAFYGRTLEEYVRFFDLDLTEWAGRRMLDCPAGASSFAADATRRGHCAVAADPLFGRPVEELAARGASDVEHVMERMRLVPHLYRWQFYTDVGALREYRLRALRLFAADYPGGLAGGRYVRAELPRLPFADESFDLVLSGHFLFTYCDRFDFGFHLDSLRELLRICAGEVRVYPIQGPDAKPYARMEALLGELRRGGIAAEVRPVPFEFQRGSNQMLVLCRKGQTKRVRLLS